MVAIPATGAAALIEVHPPGLPTRRLTDADVISPAGVRASRGTLGRDRRAAKRPKSPREVCDDKVESAKPRDRDDRLAEKRRQRNRIDRTACSWTWAFDLWHGHDLSRATGRLTGAGTRKVACANPKCGRLTPPDAIGDLPESSPYHFGAWCGDLVTKGLCEDCRWAAVTRPDADERPPRTKLDRADPGTPTVYVAAGAEVPLAETRAMGGAVSRHIVQAELPAGGTAEPSLYMPEGLTDEQAEAVREQYDAERAAYDAEMVDLAGDLAVYRGLSATDPERAKEWLREWRRKTGVR